MDEDLMYDDSIDIVLDQEAEDYEEAEDDIAYDSDSEDIDLVAGDQIEEYYEGEGEL